MKTTTTELSEQWKALLAQTPKLRIRDAAQRLGVSEAELLATRCGEGVVRLEGDWREFIKSLPKLGRIMCLTRNEHAVHERYGEFRKIGFFGPAPGIGQVVGPDIDLRLFLAHWQVGFAVTDHLEEGPRYSFHFFDSDGTAVHKVYLQPESNLGHYHELVEAYASPDQEPEQLTTPLPAPEAEKPDAEIDLAAFQKEWLELKDTHHFFMLLGKHGVSRQQALRLAPEGYAWPVKVASTEIVLETASKENLPIMVFVGSKGCIQIHTGPVKNIKWFGKDWLNVLDDEFSLHLFNTAVKTAWIVRKPVAEGGVVTSLELFDAEGENIALFFGERHFGDKEDPKWAELAESLPKEEAR
ncbi:MAG TPA: ChuX/HutX family heme-like substrate-binding protein [Chthoniobacteraceae bacterium]|nr:ChuX/HutX family heme-like substrate-binding protein [Chthoniobacteraceae bacterium]